MAGLALGAYLGGRIAHRLRAPLAGYGYAEILVGLVIAATPWAFDALASAYLVLARGTQDIFTLTAARGVLTFLVIVVPTTCMGATLPFLARLVTSDDTTGGRLPRLYALNTLGGAAGSLLSAYAVLPLLGVRGTMRAAALINIAIGVGAILLSRSMADVKPREASSAAGGASGASGEVDKELLLFAFASGFLVFAAEVVGPTCSTLLIGNSAYAFGLMLAVFLVCLGSVGARGRRRWRREARREAGLVPRPRAERARPRAHHPAVGPAAQRSSPRRGSTSSRGRAASSAARSSRSS
jgi:spermidine synthase